MKDFGYDISNFCDVSSLFGTMDDLRNLIDEMHNRGMHLLMDLVPNHTSDIHPWFVSSTQGNNPCKDYYIWKSPKMVNGQPQVPNNWESVFGGSAWTYVESRGEYYYHAFLPSQPDLNYRNPEVRQKMCEVIQFWINFGVDGFRIDAVSHLMQHPEFPDNTRTVDVGFDQEKNEKLEAYDRDQPELFEVVAEWIKLVRDYGKKNNKHILMMTEAYCSDEKLRKFYEIGVDWPFNFKLIKWGAKHVNSASQLRYEILDFMKLVASNGKRSSNWPNWVLSNHDQSRIATRLGGSQFANVANILLLLLPGTPTIYYGEELGLQDVYVSFDQVQDPFGKNLGPQKYTEGNRDPCRSPMPWNHEIHAGFTQCEKGPWLPVNPDFRDRNVESQKNDGSSNLSLFRKILELRMNDAFQNDGTNLIMVDLHNEALLAFCRFAIESEKCYLIVLNISNQEHEFDLNSLRNGEFIGLWGNKNVDVDEFAYKTVIDTRQFPQLSYDISSEKSILQSATAVIIEMNAVEPAPAKKIKI